VSRLSIVSAMLAVTVANAPLAAQEQGYWVANRASGDIMEVAPWGGVLRRIDMGVNLRSTHTAPDGKVWVVRFFDPNIDIVDPTTGAVSNFLSTLGDPYDIEFDAQGDAWVSGGSGVQHVAASGSLIQAYPLVQGAPLGITIDGLGNKWIAHRTIPGSLSRIDASGVVTNYPVSAANPVRPVADFRGPLMPSHIWLTCDAGPLIEFDENGAELNSYALPTNAVGGVGPVYDRNGDIWVGDFSSGDLYQVDPDTGALLNNYNLPPHVNGLSVDTQGRILVVQRVTFSGSGPACQVRRVDPANGTVEVVTELEFNGAVGTGTQSAVSTPFHYAMVTNPVGDSDGDGEANFTEIQNGTSPVDASSNAGFSVASVGVSTLGGSVDIVVQSSQLWVLGFSPTLWNPPVTVSGATGLLRIDDTQLVTTAQGVGGTTITLPIPNQAALVGYEVFFQGMVAPAGSLELRNVSGIRIW